MHSQQLQKSFTHVYEAFFSEHKIIFSSPFLLSRTGDVDAKYNGISIKQKIPLRMYVGIRSDSKQWVRFGSITYRDIVDYGFIQKDMCEYAPYFLELQEYISKLDLWLDKWYTINILSELPRWAGLGFDSILCTLLATALRRLSWKVQAKDFHIEERSHEDLNDIDSPMYHILRLAQQLESHLRGYQYYSGATSATMIHTPFPTVSYTEDILPYDKKTLVTAGDYKCFTYPLNTLFPEVGPIPYAAIDFWIIYSGRPTLIENTDQERSHTELSSFMWFAEQTFKHSLQGVSANRKPTFYKQLLKNWDKWDAGNILQSLLGYMSLEMLYTLQILYQKWHTEDDIKKCILAVTKLRHAHNVIRRSSSYLTNIITCLQQYFWYRGDLLGITYSESNSMWGSLLFITPLEGLRKNIFNTLSQAKRDFPACEMIYANRVDGKESLGLVCDQDLMQQKTSSFIDNSTMVLEKHDNIILGSYDELLQNQDTDILLDTIQMKIYIHGEKVTSKDLHSQTGTIEMLISVLQNVGSDISNKQLPLSSYSKCKNDMVGKIILPLIKLVRSRCKKELPLECYGSVYDYFLRLKQNDISFGIMRKVTDPKILNKDETATTHENKKTPELARW